MAHRKQCCGLLLLPLLLLATRPPPLAISGAAPQRLRGGSGDEASAAPVVVRVRTRDGIKRLSLADSSTLQELQRKLQREHKLPLAQQQCLSRGAAGADPFLDADASSSLRELGIAHGSVLHLQLATPAFVGAAVPAPPSAAATASGRTGRRRRGTTMADFEAERSQFEVVLETPKPAVCSYVAVDRAAAKRFSDFLLDTEFEARRLALLYGRWAERDGGRAGVMIDVVYEPPQLCNETSMVVREDAAALAEVERAGTIAKALGLQLVGIAYAHPPRHHVMEIGELSIVVRQRAEAIASDSRARDLFVGMRFRPVYEDEPIDADVTAEVYQPTEQFATLVNDRNVIVDGGVVDGGGHAALAAGSGLSFKVGPDTCTTADASYFFARVHDLAKPYEPPPWGRLRTSFPAANRGAPLRKFHLRTFLAKQRQAGHPFATTVADFQLLLHASALMPAESLRRLCAAVAAANATSRATRTERDAALSEAEGLLCMHAGLESKAPA